MCLIERLSEGKTLSASFVPFAAPVGQRRLINYLRTGQCVAVAPGKGWAGEACVGGGGGNVGKCRIHIWVDRRAINNNDFVWINSALLSESADLNIPNGLLPASID